MKIETQAKKIMEKIRQIEADKTTVISMFSLHDVSTQAELRLRAEWTILYPVDRIHYPKQMAQNEAAADLWRQMYRLSYDIEIAAKLVDRSYPNWKNQIIKINAKTKTGPQRRAEAGAQFIIAAGKQFLADYRAATTKTTLKKIRTKIADLQGQQKILLPQLRKSNSAYLAGKKNARQEQERRNMEALKSGEFWRADREALKSYFHPPFARNYVADVSEKWRACLILECASVSYINYSGDWRHKLSGTGVGYLCGIDDNGDEWGFRVRGLPQSVDNYDNRSLDTTVEEAMSVVFDIPVNHLSDCYRHGDLLFCPVEIPAESMEVCRVCGKSKWVNIDIAEDETYCVHCGSNYEPRIIDPPTLHPQDGPWNVRESHEICAGGGLMRNGRYFKSTSPITVTHTSHATLTLPAGGYRLYMSRVADPAD